MKQFQNKIVAVTGGSEGIGKALAFAFLNAGAKVSVCGRNPEKLQAFKSESGRKHVLTVTADVSVIDDCKRFVDETVSCFGGLDILINNAGISMRAELIDADPEIFKKLININYLGAVYCSKFALPHILKTKGTIAGISSVAGFRGLPGRSGYSGSKFAMNGWLEALRTELLETGVNVITVCPGFTQSNIRNAALTSDGSAQGESPLEEQNLMTAEACADLILEGIAARKRMLILDKQGKKTIFINKYFPKLADKLVRKFFYREGKLAR